MMGCWFVGCREPNSEIAKEYIEIALEIIGAGNNMDADKKVKSTLKDRENKRRHSIVNSFKFDGSTEEEKINKSISVRITLTTYNRL